MTRHSESDILGVTVHTGDGNPAALHHLLAALSKDGVSYSEASAILAPSPAKLIHKSMTSSGKYSFKRNSLPAVIVNYAMAAEIWARSGASPSRRLLVVQEGPLKPLADHPKLAKKLFDQINLYVPDVFPKDTAIETMIKLKDILRPLVWNLAAYDYLLTLGLPAILIASPFPTLSKETNAYLSPRAIFKQSGSGTNKVMRDKLLSMLDPNVPFLEITPTRSIWRDDAGNNSEYLRGDYGGIYEDIIRGTEIYTYPSELVGVLIAQISSGWRGDVIFLSPRGAHEEKNLELFSALGYPYKLIHLDGKVTTHNKDLNKDQSRLYASSILGTESLASALSR